MTKFFPSDRSARRAILVLNQHDIEKCRYEPGAARVLVDEELHVVQFPLKEEGDVPRALRNIRDGDLARPGAMLVQSPYDADTYETAAFASRRFALAKLMYFAELCQYLGAKQVTVEQHDLSVTSRRLEGRAGGGLHGGHLDAKLQKTELEKFRAEMRLDYRFAGGSCQLDRAEELLRRTGLLLDPMLRGLLEMRSVLANPSIGHKVKLNLSNEAESNLAVVCRIELPQFIKLASEYAWVLRERHEYKLEFSVKF